MSPAVIRHLAGAAVVAVDRSRYRHFEVPGRLRPAPPAPVSLPMNTATSLRFGSIQKWVPHAPDQP